MLGRSTFALALGLCLLFTTGSFAGPNTNTPELIDLSSRLAEQLHARRTPVYYELLNSDDPTLVSLHRNPDIRLMYIDNDNRPVYYTTTNLNAARSISTDDVWPGGSGGFTLDGSGTDLGRMAIWDAGAVLVGHQEFGGRAVQQDSPGSVHYHATHVAGTMVAEGVSTSCSGMSRAAHLACYDWDTDESEMAAAAAVGLNISNHSYATITGWYYDGQQWWWYGDPNVDPYEDWKFGSYRQSAYTWDNIAYLAPYYLIVKAASNERDDTGPPEGTPHQVYMNGSWITSGAPRDDDGGTTGFDCLPEKSTAKNVLVVGAVHDLPGGYTYAGDVTAAGFSSWGPTDDGRIKPDIVANGISLYSCGVSSTSSYTYLSGTSMAAPNASGSLNLLVRYFESTHEGASPLSSTMKALVIHTADEAGSAPGPDYSFGWGLMNTRRAAEVIEEESLGELEIIEAPLDAGTVDEYYIKVESPDPLRFTIAWTDRPGPPTSYGYIDNPDPKLVNDLDLRVEHLTDGTEHFPYTLNLWSPSSPATTGDNYRDNVEQIYIEDPDPGVYVVRVSHKREIAGSQYYSLIIPQALMVPCCGLYSADNRTGNVDQDPGDVRDLTDILMLAAWAFLSGDNPPCFADMNVSGDPGCVYDLSDVLDLASYAYLSGEPPADCLPECE